MAKKENFSPSLILEQNLYQNLLKFIRENPNQSILSLKFFKIVIFLFKCLANFFKKFVNFDKICPKIQRKFQKILQRKQNLYTCTTKTKKSLAYFTKVL